MIYISATVLVSAFAFVLLFLRYLHIFQLESYHKGGLLKWVVKRELTSVRAAAVLLLLVAGLFAAVGVNPPSYVTYCYDESVPVEQRISEQQLQAEQQETARLKDNIAMMKVFNIALLVLVGAECLRHINKKKPLVFTNRVKRLCVAFGVLSALFFAAAVSYNNHGWWEFGCGSFGYVAAAAIPLWVVVGLALADVVMMPVEALIRGRYTKQAADLLAAWNGVTIGITGSYGKTSTKFYLGELLQMRYNTVVTPRSFNTPMGVVKTVREDVKPLTEYFVCEMGAVRGGEIRELCGIVHPKYGIITSVGNQHLETFGSAEAIVKTKFELADEVIANGGIVFLNTDSLPILERYKSGGSPSLKSAVTYGFDEPAQYRAANAAVSRDGTTFDITFPDGTVREYSTCLIGEHNVLNITGAVAAAHTLGVTADETVFAVRKIKAVPHRMEIKKHGGVTIIDDGFNSNPDGARAALDALSLIGGTRVFVTPGMVELGKDEVAENKLLGAYAAVKCDYAVLIGERRAVPIKEGLLEAGFSAENITVVPTLDEALAFAQTLAGDKTILIENDLPDNY